MRGPIRWPSTTEPARFDQALRGHRAVTAVSPCLDADRHRATFDAGTEILIRGVEVDLIR